MRWVRALPWHALTAALFLALGCEAGANTSDLAALPASLGGAGCTPSWAHNCVHTQSCCEAGFTCFEKTPAWAACLKSCIPNVVQPGDDGKPFPWTCRILRGAGHPGQLELHLCALPFAGSAEPFELSFPSDPVIRHVTLTPSSAEYYRLPVELEGGRPSSVALRALGKDGLCLQGVSLDGVQAQGRLPVWIDNPCRSADYAGIPCLNEIVWELHHPATTVMATTTVTTTTRTTTMTTSTTSTSITTTTATSRTSTATSSTSTTATSSTSTTTTTATTSTSSSTWTPTTSASPSSSTWTPTTSAPNVTRQPEALEAFAEAAAPPAFYDELHAELEISVHQTGSEPWQLADFEAPVVEAIVRFVGLAPPSSLGCRLSHPSSDQLLAELDARIEPGSSVSAEEVQKRLRDPEERRRLNELLAQIRLPAEGATTRGSAPPGLQQASVDGALPSEPVLGQSWQQPDDSGDDDAAPGEPRGDPLLGNASFAFMTTCQEGALFCCVRAVVDNIVHSAGVVRAYTGYFPMAVLLSVGVCGVTLWALTPHFKEHRTHSELERGRLVMPLFFLAVIFQAFLFTFKSVQKYHMLVHNCSKDTPLSSCPPSPVALCLEVAVFGGGSLAALLAFWLWWRMRFRADCRAERLQHGHRRQVVWPLESVLRRSDFFSWAEVRSTDKASRAEHLLCIVLNILLSLAVTLTSFFALQRYSFPSGLTAWLPYKLCYELFIACALKLAVRKVARTKLLGSFTFAFLSACAAMLAALVAWMWVTIAGTFLVESHRHFRAWRIIRLLDIAVGAGLVNCILSPLSISFSMYFFSVYAYEPHLRSSVIRCVHLAQPEAQADELVACLDQDQTDESEGTWEVVGVRTARGERLRIPKVDEEESSEDEEEQDEESAPCVVTHPSGPSELPSSVASGQSTAERMVESLVGVAKAQPRRCQPVIVDLRRAGARPCASRMVCLLDYFLSVDSRLPVSRRWASRYEELEPEDGARTEEDEDDFVSSDSDGSASTSSSTSSSSSRGARRFTPHTWPLRARAQGWRNSDF